jgi:hypothetical protein
LPEQPREPAVPEPVEVPRNPIIDDLMDSANDAAVAEELIRLLEAADVNGALALLLKSRR